MSPPGGSTGLDQWIPGAFYDRGGEKFNIKHPEFGAKGNGLADDTAAVQAAIDAASAGDTIVFPRASAGYIITETISVTKSLHFRMNPGSIIDIRLPINSDERLFDVQVGNVSFKGLVFDGANSPAGTLTTRHACIFIGKGTGTQLTNFSIEKCQFLNISRKGAHDTGSTGNESLKSDYGIYIINVARASVNRCAFTAVSGCAIFVDLSRRVYIQDNPMVEMLSTSDCLYPIHLDSDVDGCWIERNYVTGGNRASGGAIDVMSQIGTPNPAPCKRIFVRENIVDSCNGFGSGSNVIRYDSVESGEVKNNILMNIQTPSDGTEGNYISVNARTGTVDQPGPKYIEVAGNKLICGGSNWRGIDIRNDNKDDLGGTVIDCHHNQLIPDGTNWFAAGIRGRDINYLKIRHNFVDFKRDATIVSQPHGIVITTSKRAMLMPEVEGNDVECNSIASSQGIQVDGATGKDITNTIIDNNKVRNAASSAVRLETGAIDTFITRNKFYNGPVNPITDNSGSNTHKDGNRYNMSAKRSGTGTIPSGSSSVVISTAEVRTGDNINITVNGNAATDQALKVSAISNAVSFTVRTIGNGNAGADITFTWEIRH